MEFDFFQLLLQTRYMAILPINGFLLAQQGHRRSEFTTEIKKGLKQEIKSVIHSKITVHTKKSPERLEQHVIVFF